MNLFALLSELKLFGSDFVRVLARIAKIEFALDGLDNSKLVDLTDVDNHDLCVQSGTRDMLAIWTECHSQHLN